MIGKSGPSLCLWMVVEPKTGYLLYSPVYVVPIEGALDGHSSHFSCYRRSPEGICSQLSTFPGEMGVCNQSKPCGWLEYQRLSELEHICARYKLDLTSDIVFWATTPSEIYHTCIYATYISCTSSEYSGIPSNTSYSTHAEHSRLEPQWTQ